MSFNLKKKKKKCDIEWPHSRTVKLYMRFVRNKREMYPNYFILVVFRNKRSSKSSFHQVLTVKSQVRSVFLFFGYIQECVYCSLWVPNSSSLCMLSQLFICTVNKQVARLRVHWHWVSGGLNCCGAVSGCIAEQVVPLCLSVFACVKLPPLPSSILSSSLQLCPSINPSTLSEPTPSLLLQ